MVDQLSHFEAPTGFAIAANSATASLNDRKELLDDLDLLNRVGRKQDDITLTDDYDLFIGGMRLTEINATLEQQGAGELTLMPTSTFRTKMGATYSALGETDVKLINPAPVPRLFSDKAMQYWELYNAALPVPPWQPLDHYIRSESDLGDALRRDFIVGAPLVVKARSSTHGKGIWFYPGGITDFTEDWSRQTAPTEVLSSPEQFLIQYAVPHECDVRVVAAGSTPIAGEYRYGSPDTDKSNLNLVETDAKSLRATTEELLDRGAVTPLAMDRLDPAVERAVYDLYEALVSCASVPAEEFHSWIGWDFLMVTPTDERLDVIPDAVLERLLDDRYRTKQGYYLVFGEGNLSPGSKERYVNALVHGRDGLDWDSAANLWAYGDSISKGESFTPGLPDQISREELEKKYHI